MSTLIQPTPPNERHHFLDVLRGFALFGVLIANMAYHSGYWFMSPEQQQALPMSESGDVLLWIIHFVTDGKFYSLFSLLFGLGFALQLERSMKRQQPFASRFARRLFVLLLFGLAHALLIWVGDILTLYALLGFLLLLFRNTSDKWLLRWTVILLILPIVQYAIMWSQAPPPTMEAAPYPPFFEQLTATYRTGGVAEIIQMNIGGTLMARWPDIFFTGRIFRVFAMFLLGYYVARKGLYKISVDHKKLMKKVLLWGLLIGIPCNIILANMMESDAYYGFWDTGIFQPIVYAFGVPALGLAFAAGLNLLFRKETYRYFLMVLAPFGRMALTNYLMQSIICVLIYQSYGLQLYATEGPLQFTLVACGIFIFQLIFSHLWLSRFQYGPMEWLWRSLTYKKFQPMKINQLELSN